MDVAIDKQGRIVIPKKVREKYGLLDGDKVELVARENSIELIPLTDEDEPEIRSLREPCKTGNHETAKRAWKRLE